MDVKPFRFTGKVDELDWGMKENHGFKLKKHHNLNTFCVFTVIANGLSYTSRTTTQHLQLLPLGQSSSWGFGDEGVALRESDGSSVALYTPMSIISAEYNLTPGTDNQKDINTVVQGTKLAGDAASLVATAIYGPEAGKVVSEVAPIVVEFVAFIGSFFHKSTPTTIGLRCASGMTLNYADVVKGSNEVTKQFTGTTTFDAGESEVYGALWGFSARFSWHRDNL